MKYFFCSNCITLWNFSKKCSRYQKSFLIGSFCWRTLRFETSSFINKGCMIYWQLMEFITSFCFVRVQIFLFIFKTMSFTLHEYLSKYLILFMQFSRHWNVIENNKSSIDFLVHIWICKVATYTSCQIKPCLYFLKVYY